MRRKFIAVIMGCVLVMGIFIVGHPASAALTPEGSALTAEESVALSQVLGQLVVTLTNLQKQLPQLETSPTKLDMVVLELGNINQSLAAINATILARDEMLAQGKSLKEITMPAAPEKMALKSETIPTESALTPSEKTSANQAPLEASAGETFSSKNWRWLIPIAIVIIGAIFFWRRKGRSKANVATKSMVAMPSENSQNQPRDVA